MTDPCQTSPPWVMVRRKSMDYGIWERLVCLAGNRLGGHMKVWLMGGYGLSQVWVKTESTVTTNNDRAPYGFA
jgi:hypothetical protein